MTSTNSNIETLLNPISDYQIQTKYQWAVDARKMQQSCHWTEGEVDLIGFTTEFQSFPNEVQEALKRFFPSFVSTDNRLSMNPYTKFRIILRSQSISSMLIALKTWNLYIVLHMQIL